MPARRLCASQKFCFASSMVPAAAGRRQGETMYNCMKELKAVRRFAVRWNALRPSINQEAMRSKSSKGAAGSCATFQMCLKLPIVCNGDCIYMPN